MNTSRISSLLTPLRSAPPMWSLSSCSLLNLAMLGAVEQAAGFFRQLLAAPHRAPAIFGHEFLERPAELVGALQGILHVFLAEHRLADLQSLFECLLVHDGSSRLIKRLVVVRPSRPSLRSGTSG